MGASSLKSLRSEERALSEKTYHELVIMNDQFMKMTDSIVFLFRQNGSVATFNVQAGKFCQDLGIRIKNLNFNDFGIEQENEEGQMDLSTLKSENVFLKYKLKKMEFDGHTYVLFVGHDVTLQVLTEKALIQISQLQMLADLSSGVAHEVNNPLAIIMTIAGFLRHQIEANGQPISQEKLLESMQAIERSSDRIAKMVRSLKTMARINISDPYNEESVNDVIHHVLRLTKFKVKRAKIRFVTPENLDQIKMQCRESELVHSLIGIFDHCCESLKSSAQPNKQILLSVKCVNDQIQFRFEDNGRLQDAELREKILRPDYYQVQEGKVIDLGLSPVLQFAARSGGRVYFEDELNRNTIVLELPLKQNQS